MNAWRGCASDSRSRAARSRATAQNPSLLDEQVKWFGDDLVAKGDARFVDFDGGRSDVAYLIGHLGAGRPPLERLRLGMAFLSGAGRRAADTMFENHWLATAALAEALHLDAGVLDSLAQTFERWDGKGLFKARGTACPLTARVTILVDVIEVYHRVGGVDAAVAAARERSGTQFDPQLVALFADAAHELLDGLDSIDAWNTVIDAAPALHRRIGAAEVEPALEAVADFTDLKSPYTLGHSRRVADVAAAAADRIGLTEDEVRLVRGAGLLHDLGRLGVKPIAGTDSCEFPHFMYVITGRMRVRMDDGNEVELRAGDVASIPPGHDAEVLGNEPCITVDLGEDDADYAKRT